MAPWRRNSQRTSSETRVNSAQSDIHIGLIMLVGAEDSKVLITHHRYYSSYPEYTGSSNCS
jgi:hypothetical protein